MIERIVDIVAKELHFDRVELRKRNYVQPEDYPYETPNALHLRLRRSTRRCSIARSS